MMIKNTLLKTKSLFLVLIILISGMISAQNVGIGTAAPASKLDINGGATIGTDYSGTHAAPTNGAIIEGPVGIGNYTPNGSAILDLNNASNLGLLLPNLSSDPTIPSSGTGSIATPGGGLLIYNTSTKCVDVYVNGHWEPVYCSCPTLQTLTGLTGPSSVCYSSSNTYTVTALQGASTYTWSVTGSPTITGQGTNAISIYPGASLTNYTVSVTAYNACSVSSTASTSSMTVNEFTGAPATPTWSGTAPASSVCLGASSVGYTITSGLGVNGTSAQTYNWTFTATGTGTTASIVSTGQTISVGSPVTISGTTTLSYALNYGSTSGGSITVSVTATNLCGTSSTPLAQTVSIAAQPSLSAITPLSQVVCASGTTGPASITTVSTPSGGAGTISYQWYTSTSQTAVSGSISLGTANGANTLTYTRPATTTQGTTYLYMTMAATGAGCTTAYTSLNNASIQVVAQPSLTAPTGGGQSVCTTGQIATPLTSTASGGTGVSPVYQWYSCTSSTGTTGSTALSTGTGYNTTACTPAAASSAGTAYYYMTFSTTGAGCVAATSLSNNPLVTTVAQPTISNPTAINECSGGTTALTVAGSNGTGTGTYTWYSNGTTNSNSGGIGASGATNSTSYTPSSASAGTTYYYATYGTSGAGCSTSAPTSATAVAVNATPTLTTAPLTATAVCYYTGGAQTTSATYATATNSPDHYNINWTGIANQTSTANTFAATSGTISGITVPASTAAGTYTGNLIISIASTGCSTTYTNGISVTVNAALSATISGPTTVGAQQQTVQYSTTSGASNYVWSVTSGSATASSTSIYNPTYSWSTGNTLGTQYPTTLNVTYAISGCTYSGSYSVTAGGNYSSTVASSTATVWPASTTNWAVSKFLVQLWGGGGAGGDYGSGGSGGYVSGTIVTTSSTQQFNTWVGGTGQCCVSQSAGGVGYGIGGTGGKITGTAPAGTGGGGGGATAIGVSGGIIAVAAGGGGGGGIDNNYYSGGGGGGNTATTPNSSAGGGIDTYSGDRANYAPTVSAGGTTSASGNGAGGAVTWGSSGCGCTPGNPGTGSPSATSGATGGAGNTTAATTYAGGGGGGGYYGGGGGAGSSAVGNSMAGGGGGTNYSGGSPSGVTYTSSANTGGLSCNCNSGTAAPYTTTNYIGTSGQGGNFLPAVGSNGEIFISY